MQSLGLDMIVVVAEPQSVVLTEPPIGATEQSQSVTLIEPPVGAIEQSHLASKCHQFGCH